MSFKFFDCVKTNGIIKQCYANAKKHSHFTVLIFDNYLRLFKQITHYTMFIITCIQISDSQQTRLKLMKYHHSLMILVSADHIHHSHLNYDCGCWWLLHSRHMRHTVMSFSVVWTERCQITCFTQETELSTKRAHSLALCFYYYHPSTLNKSTCNPLTAKNMLNSVAVLSASHLSRKWREDLYNISEFISRHNTVMPRTRSYGELKLVLWQSTWMRTQPEATWARKQGSRLLYDDFNTFLYESLNVN